jgi:ABC-2 type transport system ATP-binding protein
VANAIELLGVRKSFDGHVAVDDLSLAVPTGSVFGLLGPNGAGKTTSIRMVMGILGPDRGEVRLFGRPRQAGDGRRIGYLPEERGLYRKMTVEEQLHFLAELNGVARAKAKRLVHDWLERVELSAWARKKLEALSKGMQQKIQLVGTVLHEPELLVLDEPFSGLDPLNQELFRGLIAKFAAAGRTIVFSTHVMEHAEKLCDAIALVAKGRVILAGELAAIKRERGERAVEATFERPPGELGELPGAAAVELDQERARIALAPGARPADLLAALVARGLPVASFRALEPDLESIFVHAVRSAN